MKQHNDNWDGIVRNSSVDEGVFSVVKKMFGYGKPPEERLEIARDAIRWYKKNPITTWSFPAPLGTMKIDLAYEYVYVWGRPEESKEAEEWLRNSKNMLGGHNYSASSIANLKKKWSHDSTWAAYQFASTKCCSTSPRGKI